MSVIETSTHERGAWGRVQDHFQRRRIAWRHALLGDDGTLSVAGEIVVRDLQKFCRAFESTAVYSPVTGALDPIASAKADGRREVYLRVAKMLNLSEAEAMRLANSGE